jgi:hypothetical protein
MPPFPGQETTSTLARICQASMVDSPSLAGRRQQAVVRHLQRAEDATRQAEGDRRACVRHAVCCCTRRARRGAADGPSQRRARGSSEEARHAHLSG